MTGQPKYISKEILAKIQEREEKSIFEDILNLLKQGASYPFIQNFIEDKYCLDFSLGVVNSLKHATRYIRGIINKFVPNCIICGQPRYHSAKFTLFCKYHFEENIRQNEQSIKAWEKDLLQDMAEHCHECFGTHGDLTDKAAGIHNKLGTTNIGPHRQKDFKKEAQVVANEFERLGLKHEKKSK